MLTVDDFLAYARQLGLDEDRFFDDLDSRRFALRVARDVRLGVPDGEQVSTLTWTATWRITMRQEVKRYEPNPDPDRAASR